MRLNDSDYKYARRKGVNLVVADTDSGDIVYFIVGKYRSADVLRSAEGVIRRFRCAHPDRDYELMTIAEYEKRAVEGERLKNGVLGDE